MSAHSPKMPLPTKEIRAAEKKQAAAGGNKEDSR